MSHAVQGKRNQRLALTSLAFPIIHLWPQAQNQCQQAFLHSFINHFCMSLFSSAALNCPRTISGNHGCQSEVRIAFCFLEGMGPMAPEIQFPLKSSSSKGILPSVKVTKHATEMAKRLVHSRCSTQVVSSALMEILDGYLARLQAAVEAMPPSAPWPESLPRG